MVARMEVEGRKRSKIKKMEVVKMMKKMLWKWMKISMETLKTCPRRRRTVVKTKVVGFNLSRVLKVEECI